MSIQLRDWGLPYSGTLHYSGTSTWKPSITLNVIQNSNPGRTTLNTEIFLSFVGDSFPVHSCVVLPPGDVRTLSREGSWVGTAVGLEFEGRGSWYSFVYTQRIRWVRYHKTIPTDLSDYIKKRE